MRLIKIDESDDRILYINPESVVAVELDYSNYGAFKLLIKTNHGEFNIPLGQNGCRLPQYCSHADKEYGYAEFELDFLIERLAKDEEEDEEE